MNNIKDFFLFCWGTIYLCIHAAYIYIRCKITRTEYYPGGFTDVIIGEIKSNPKRDKFIRDGGGHVWKRVKNVVE